MSTAPPVTILHLLPTNGFPGGHLGSTYSISATADAILDSAHALPSSTLLDHHSFHVADASPPLLVSSIPAPNARINPDLTILLTFDEPIEHLAAHDNTTDITLSQISPSTTTNASPTTTTHIAASQVSGYGTNILTIALSAITISTSGVYELHIPSSILQDTHGLRFAATTLSFTFLDVTRPTLTAIAPSDGLTPHYRNQSLSFMFSEAVFPGFQPFILSDATGLEVTYIDASDPLITYNGSIVTLEASPYFLLNDEAFNVYSLTITRDAVVDAADISNGFLGKTRAVQVAIINTVQDATCTINDQGAGVTTFANFSFATMLPIGPYDYVVVTLPAATNDGHSYSAGYQLPSTSAVGTFVFTAADAAAGVDDSAPAVSFSTLVMFDQTNNTITVQNLEMSTIPGGSNVTFAVEGITLPTLPGLTEAYGIELKLPSDPMAPVCRARAAGTNILNAHLPTFANTTYRVYLSETAVYEDIILTPVFIPRPVTTMVATDYDEGATAPITYRIVSATPSVQGMFELDGLTGVLQTLRYVDYETDPKEYVLVIEATDGMPPYGSSNTTLTVEIVDVNDHVPVFEVPAPLPYYTAIMHESGTAIDDTIIQVQALDIDGGGSGNVTYAIEPSTADFDIDSNSGQLTATRIYSRAARPWTVLRVTAVDEADPTTGKQHNTSVLVSVDTLSDAVLAFSTITTAVKGAFLPADFESYVTDIICEKEGDSCQMQATVYNFSVQSDSFRARSRRSEEVDVSLFVRIVNADINTPSRILLMQPEDLITKLEESASSVTAIDRGFLSATFAASSTDPRIVPGQGISDGADDTSISASKDETLTTSMIIAIGATSLLVLVGCILIVHAINTRNGKDIVLTSHSFVDARSKSASSAAAWANTWGVPTLHHYPGSDHRISLASPRASQVMSPRSPISYDNQDHYMDPVSAPYAMHSTYGINSPGGGANSSSMLMQSPHRQQNMADNTYFGSPQQQSQAPTGADMQVMFEGDESYFGQQFNNPLYNRSPVHQNQNQQHAAAAWRQATQQATQGSQQMQMQRRMQEEDPQDEYIDLGNESNVSPRRASVARSDFAGEDADSDFQKAFGDGQLPGDDDWSDVSKGLNARANGGMPPVRAAPTTDLGGSTPAGGRWPTDDDDDDEAWETRTANDEANGNDDLVDNWASNEDALRTIFEDDTADDNQFITLGKAGF
jgi:hypothetical protein